MIIRARPGVRTAPSKGARALRESKPQKPTYKISIGDKTLPMSTEKYLDAGYQYNPNTNSLEKIESKVLSNRATDMPSNVVTSRIVLDEAGNPVKEQKYDAVYYSGSTSGSFARKRMELSSETDITKGTVTPFETTQYKGSVGGPQPLSSQEWAKLYQNQAETEAMRKAIYLPGQDKYMSAGQATRLGILNERGDIIETVGGKQQITLGQGTKGIIDKAVGYTKMPVKDIEILKQPTKETIISPFSEQYKPIYSNGKVTGIEDRFARQSIDVRQPSALFSEQLAFEDFRTQDVNKRQRELVEEQYQLSTIAKTISDELPKDEQGRILVDDYNQAKVAQLFEIENRLIQSAEKVDNLNKEIETIKQEQEQTGFTKKLSRLQEISKEINQKQSLIDAKVKGDSDFVEGVKDWKTYLSPTLIVPALATKILKGKFKKQSELEKTQFELATLSLEANKIMDPNFERKFKEDLEKRKQDLIKQAESMNTPLFQQTGKTSIIGIKQGEENLEKNKILKEIREIKAAQLSGNIMDIENPTLRNALILGTALGSEYYVEPKTLAKEYAMGAGFGTILRAAKTGVKFAEAGGKAAQVVAKIGKAGLSIGEIALLGTVGIGATMNIATAPTTEAKLERLGKTAGQFYVFSKGMKAAGTGSYFDFKKNQYRDFAKDFSRELKSSEEFKAVDEVTNAILEQRRSKVSAKEYQTAYDKIRQREKEAFEDIVVAGEKPVDPFKQSYTKWKELTGEDMLKTKQPTIKTEGSYYEVPEKLSKDIIKYKDTDKFFRTFSKTEMPIRTKTPWVEFKTIPGTSQKLVTARVPTPFDLVKSGERYKPLQKLFIRGATPVFTYGPFGARFGAPKDINVAFEKPTSQFKVTAEPSKNIWGKPSVYNEVLGRATPIKEIKPRDIEPFESFEPQTPGDVAVAKIIQMKYSPKQYTEIVEPSLELGRELIKVKSGQQEILAEKTRTLGEKPVQAVIDVANKYNAEIYGSYPTQALQKIRPREAGDIDVQFEVSTPRANAIVRETTAKFRDAGLKEGKDYRVTPQEITTETGEPILDPITNKPLKQKTLIEVKTPEGWAHAVDVHSSDYGGEMIGQWSYGFQQIPEKVSIKTESGRVIESPSLREQMRRKQASTFTLQKAENAVEDLKVFGDEIIASPKDYRAKDVSDYYIAQRNLIELGKFSEVKKAELRKRLDTIVEKLPESIKSEIKDAKTSKLLLKSPSIPKQSYGFLSSASLSSPSASISPYKSPSISPYDSPYESPSISPSVSIPASVSPSISPSISISSSISPSVSPLPSPSPSPSPSRSISGFYGSSGSFPTEYLPVAGYAASPMPKKTSFGFGGEQYESETIETGVKTIEELNRAFKKPSVLDFLSRNPKPIPMQYKIPGRKVRYNTVRYNNNRVGYNPRSYSQPMAQPTQTASRKPTVAKKSRFEFNAGRLMPAIKSKKQFTNSLGKAKKMRMI